MTRQESPYNRQAAKLCAERARDVCQRMEEDVVNDISNHRCDKERDCHCSNRDSATGKSIRCCGGEVSINNGKLEVDALQPHGDTGDGGGYELSQMGVWCVVYPGPEIESDGRPIYQNNHAVLYMHSVAYRQCWVNRTLAL